MPVRLLHDIARAMGKPCCILAAIGATLGGCTVPPATETASLATNARATPKLSSLPENAAPLAAAHRANPGDAAAARAYARALRSADAKAEALAVLDTTAAKTTDRRLTLERGLLALELGHAEKAETLLRQAQDPKAPDWRLHSALGAALASRGKQQEAQVQFAKALALAPDHPTVLNNLALSYVLEGKAQDAEKLLRKARREPAVAPQVDQNLALVLGLRGRFDEAKTAAAGTLSADKAGANIAYLQTLTNSKNGEVRAGSATPKTSASLPQPTYQLGGPQ